MDYPCRVVQSNTTGNVYISNGIHKRLLLAAGSETVAEQILAFIYLGWVPPSDTTPVPTPNDTLNQIRTV